MAIDLDQSEKELEKHFTLLAESRRATSLPIFALEHGLSLEQWATIEASLLDLLNNGFIADAHWLLWVVYAAEQGYAYDGAEYWHSFEERMPNWRPHRNTIRNWYQKFHRTFGGVKPTGPWAEHFPIIAWPITHAILPSYLQRHLARALYNARYRLASLASHNPLEVGKLVSAYAYDPPSRFEYFLQQKELVGRIVLALIKEQAEEGIAQIQEDTLARIVGDLEKKQSSREWLRDAQRVFAATQIKGTSSNRLGQFQSVATSTTQEVGKPNLSDACIKPELTLQRTTAEAWTVILDIPSFVGIANLSPQLKEFLQSVRCRVAGSGATWLARGWLMSGCRRRLLTEWPDPATSIVSFERANKQMEYLLQSECKLSPGPWWVCLVDKDGVAREVVSGTVRLGQRYILLQIEALPDIEFLEACQVKCDGIYAAVLNLPSTLSDEALARLRSIGINVARTIRIQPIGLAARYWDGEGAGEWLSTEEPCFSISHNHSVDAYEVILNGQHKLQLTPGRLGQATFFSLERLPIGKHILSIVAKHHEVTGVERQPDATGAVTLFVREPMPWSPGTLSNAGLVVETHPEDATVDDFWEGEVSVNVWGPDSRVVTFSISLADLAGVEISNESIGEHTLPVTQDAWARIYKQFSAKERDLWPHLAAASGCLMIDGDDLGMARVSLSRDVKPVRWTYRKVAKSGIVLRLVDDSGVEEEPVVTFFDFKHPTLPIEVKAQAALREISPAAPGGLYVANRNGGCTRVVVSVPRVERTLQELAFDPIISFDEENGSLVTLLEMLEQWSDARHAGPLAAIRQHKVIFSVQDTIFMRLCGQAWITKERQIRDSPKNTDGWRELEGKVGNRALTYGIALGKEALQLHSIVGDEILQKFSTVSERFGICSERPTCEAAIRLAFQPQRYRKWAGENIEDQLAKLDANRALLRGARLLAVLSEAHDPEAWNLGMKGWVYC
jgi:hypothetical protein